MRVSRKRRQAGNDIVVSGPNQVPVPGETAAPGTVSGKTGNTHGRPPVIAFIGFVNAVDELNASTRTPTLPLMTTDVNAAISPLCRSTGRRNENIQRVVENRRRFENDHGDRQYTPATPSGASSAITATAPRTASAARAGRTVSAGYHDRQDRNANRADFLGTAFTGIVNAVDAQVGNKITTNTDSTRSQRPTRTPPASAALVAGIEDAQRGH